MHCRMRWQPIVMIVLAVPDAVKGWEIPLFSIHTTCISFRRVETLRLII